MQEDDARDPRPGLTLFPEYGVDVPVWHGPGGERHGLVDADQLSALGVSPGLVERLAAWQEGWDHDPFGMGPPERFREGNTTFVRLARQLQAELPGFRVHLRARSGLVLVDEWPG